MTSDRAYVWVWLPGATEPVVAGALDPVGNGLHFTYGRSYLDRREAIALYLPELPLRRGAIRPPAGMRMAGCIDDAGPDAWGQRVVLHRHVGAAASDTDPAVLGPLTYLLESGSDRIGGLDFQRTPDAYEPRDPPATLVELQQAADRLQAGEPFSPALDQVLLHGSSLGGARPKAALDDGGRKLIAKFSSTTDPYPVVKAEAVAMNLARRVGLDVAGTEITECLGRDVLLVERFDRTAPGERRLMVSALTILQLDEMLGRYATYWELADIIRERFTGPRATLRELFARIVFNICIGNTDDHARNHAAFWDGTMLTLTPAFDICPQTRSGGIAAQAMAFGRDGARASRLADCILAAPDTYLLTPVDARSIVDRQLEVINSQWADAADEARLTAAERNQLWHRQILNPIALEDL